MRKNHFVEHLIAGVSGEKPDVLIKPAITPDVLPEVFHIPAEQMAVPYSQFELPAAGTVTEPSAETYEQEMHKKLQINISNNIDDQEKISKKNINDLTTLKEQDQGEHAFNEDNKAAKDKSDLENPELIKSNTRTTIEKKMEGKTSRAAESTVAATSSNSTDNNNTTSAISRIKDTRRKKKVKEPLLPSPSQPLQQPLQSSVSSLSNTTKKVHADKKEIHENQIFFDRTNVKEEKHNALYDGRFPSENINTENLTVKPSTSPTIIPDKFAKRDEEGRLLYSTTSFKKTYSPPHSNGGGRVLLYPSEPTVTINIGRIEVHAISSQQQQKSSTKMQQQKKQQPSLSLKEYLKQRSEGRL